MTAWTRSRRPSLASRWPTWVLTVASVTTSSLAISVLLLPRATSRRMSRSRGVSDASREGRGMAVSGRRANASISRRVTGGGHPHGGDQVRAGRVLQQETAGAGAQRLVDVVIQVEGGEDDDFRRGGEQGDLPGGRQSVHHRHAHVHQHHVRFLAGRELDGPHAVGRLPGDHEPGGLEDHAKAGPDQLLIVYDEHAKRIAGHHATGSRAVTAKPPRGSGPTVSDPPQEATRSAMPARPNPCASRAGSWGAAAPVEVAAPVREAAPVSAIRTVTKA